MTIRLAPASAVLAHVGWRLITHRECERIAIFISRPAVPAGKHLDEFG